MVRFLLERIAYYWHWIRFQVDLTGLRCYSTISHKKCVLGDIFSPGLSLSGEGVGCSGGSVWLERGKREEKKDGVCKTSCGRSAAS